MNELTELKNWMRTDNAANYEHHTSHILWKNIMNKISELEPIEPVEIHSEVEIEKDLQQKIDIATTLTQVQDDLVNDGEF